MIQTYTPVRGMITCIDGGEFVKTSDHLFEIAKKDKEIEELKEKIQEIENQKVVEKVISTVIGRPCRVRCAYVPEDNHLVEEALKIGAQIIDVEEK